MLGRNGGGRGQESKSLAHCDQPALHFAESAPTSETINNQGFFIGEGGLKVFTLLKFGK